MSVSATHKAAAPAASSSSSSATSSSSSRASSSSPKMSWLKAEGDHLVDESGKRVVLRGVNLGGFLAEEMWMMPFVTEPKANSTFKPITDRTQLWNTIKTRFGQKDSDDIRSRLRKAWFNEADFAKIKAAGCNSVRLPFLCESMDEAEGLLPLLDTAIDAAKKQGIYVILDMHGTYGGQSSSAHTGCLNRNEMFSKPELVEKSCQVWEKIAARYKDRPEVAGFDLINEPMGAPSRKELHTVHDKMYKKIRAIDTRHLIFIEDGFKGISHIPDPAKKGWKNVVFSLHVYAKGDSADGNGKKTESEFLAGLDTKLKKIGEYMKTLKVPFYVGEFNFKPYDEKSSVKKFITQLQEKSISWSYWTYKFAGKHGSMSSWGLYCRPKKLKFINPFEDSLQVMREKILNLFTLNFDLNREVHSIFSETKI